MEHRFTAAINCTTMPGGWFYLTVPQELSRSLSHLAKHFGFVAITARVGQTVWDTSLVPMGSGVHGIPLPAKVRTQEKLSLGDEVEISFDPR